MLEPKGRVAMVSGAGRGIGRAVAERLHAAGYHVSAGLRRPGGDTPAPSSASSSDSWAVFPYEAGDPASATAWVEGTMARLGRIDVLVNAAGINPVARMLDADEAPFDAMWDVNAKGPMRVIRAAWPHLVACGEGRVINLASLSGKRVRNENLGYAMSKFAVMALTQEVRRLGFEHGIRASAVAPSFVDTDMTGHVTTWPRERMSRPEDLAAMIEALVRLPNTASVAELLLNCRHEDML